ncbi:H1FOO protein, partial [Nothoprocta ornata]|nr:H1FOO protein [Nothoprocta ornata]
SGSAAGARAPALQQRRHPSTLTMVVEALEARGDKRGTSALAIRRYILAKYPSVDAVRLKRLLKRALAVGLSRGLLVRPRDSAALGATGRFKVSSSPRGRPGTDTPSTAAIPTWPLLLQLAPEKQRQ